MYNFGTLWQHIDLYADKCANFVRLLKNTKYRVYRPILNIFVAISYCIFCLLHYSLSVSLLPFHYSILLLSISLWPAFKKIQSNKKIFSLVSLIIHMDRYAFAPTCKAISGRLRKPQNTYLRVHWFVNSEFSSVKM